MKIPLIVTAIAFSSLGPWDLAQEKAPTIFSTDDTFDVGEDWDTPSTPIYKLPFKFTGTMKSVTIEVKQPLLQKS